MSAATGSGGLLNFLPFDQFFTLDARSLALSRIGLGTVIALDWIDRLTDLSAHYSDAGIVPREAIPSVQPISVHLYHGSAEFQAVLAVVAIVVALLLVVGWRTPLMCLISWFLLISVHARNPALLQGGDHLIRILPFWGMFLPLGAYFSLDAVRAKERPTSPRVLTPASFAYVVQIGLIYFFAAAWKWAPEWREDGTAVYLSLGIDAFTTRFGHLLMRWPEVLTWLTRGAMWLETLGPVLLLLPFNVGLQRLVAVGLFVLFHIGLALSMELGNFPWVCMVAWLALLPGSLWDKIAASQSELPLAQRFAAWLKGLIGKPTETGRPAWTPPGGLVINAVVLFLLAYIVMLNTRNLVHSSDQAFPDPNRPPDRWRSILPDLNYSFGSSLGIDQGWGLFAPRPGRFAGWWLVVGVRADGSRIDLMNGGQPIDEEIKPAFPAGQFANGRWRKLFLNTAIYDLDALPNPPTPWYDSWRYADDGEGYPRIARLPNNPRDPRWSYPYLLPGMASYFLRDWNERHKNDPLKAVEIIWWKEETRPPGEQPPTPRRILLIRHEPTAGPLPRDQFRYHNPIRSVKPHDPGE